MQYTMLFYAIVQIYIEGYANFNMPYSVLFKFQV